MSYRAVAAVHSLSTTAQLPTAVYLYDSVPLQLEDKLCAELGLVRGCLCILREVVFDGATPDATAACVQPIVLSRVPLGIVVEIPFATRTKDVRLGPGRLYLPRTKRSWSFRFVAVDGSKATSTIERLQLPVTNVFAMTAYALQGCTEDYIILDLARPPGMSRVSWLHVRLVWLLLPCLPISLRTNVGSRCLSC